MGDCGGSGGGAVAVGDCGEGLMQWGTVGGGGVGIGAVAVGDCGEGGSG